jgi:hypothetical protein
MFNQTPQDYLIVKRGRSDRYVRVCQSRLSSPNSVRLIVHRLLQQARADQAIGIRWAVYDEGAKTDQLVAALQRMGFLCARRTRIVMVHKDFPAYLQPSAWSMSDTHFCFDP